MDTTEAVRRVRGRIDSGRLLLACAVVLATCWVQAIASFDHLSKVGMAAGSVPFILALTGADIALVVFPRRIERVFARPPWVAVALGVSLATSLSGLSYGQDIFDSTVFSALSSVLLGFACIVLVVATMVPALHLFSRGSFLLLVFGSYIAKRIFEGAVTNLTFDAVVALVAFVLPFVITLMANIGIRKGETPLEEIRPKATAWSPWVIALAVSSICVIVLFGGTNARVSLSENPGAFVWDLAGSTLILLASGLAVSRATVAETYRPLFVIGTIAAVLALATGGIGIDRIPWETLTVLCGILLWLPTYDCMHAGIAAPLRLYGACGAGHTVLSAFVANGETGASVALWITCALALIASAVSLWLERKEQSGASPAAVTTDGLALPEALTRVCNELAQANDLSKREAEVLRLLAQGMSRQAIGEELLLSEATVKTHIYRIYNKLGVHSQTDLAKRLYG